MKSNFLTINCHGLRSSDKRLQIMTWLKQQKADVIFLQETHLQAADKSLIQQQWDGLLYLSPGESHSKGVISLYNKKLNPTLVSNYIDPFGRLINTVLNVNDERLQFCNVYAPNHVTNRTNFFSSLISILKGGIPTILGGDFNCIEGVY